MIAKKKQANSDNVSIEKEDNKSCEDSYKFDNESWEDNDVNKDIINEWFHQDLENSGSNSDKKSDEKSDPTSSEEEVDPVLQKIISREQTHFKPSSLVMIPSLFFAIILVSLLRGNSNMDSIVGVKSWSPVDFILLIGLILFMIIMTISNIILVKKEHRLKVEHGYKFVDGDLHWTPKLLIQFMIGAIGAGLMAGTIGAGGGVIFNPLLLSFGVSPAVASASGMYIIMFSTLANSIQYAMAGTLIFGHAFWAGSFVVLGAVLGLMVINGIVKRTGRTSYIAAALWFIIILSAFVVPIYGAIQTKQKLDDGQNIFKFGSYCR
jgi:uncharacterized membrane protein YfcA